MPLSTITIHSRHRGLYQVYRPKQGLILLQIGLGGVHGCWRYSKCHIFLPNSTSLPNIILVSTKDGASYSHIWYRIFFMIFWRTKVDRIIKIDDFLQQFRSKVPNPKSQVPNLPKSMGWVGYWTYMRKVCENGKMWKHLEKTLLRVDLSGPAQGNPLGKKQSKHSLCLSKPRQYGQDCLETIL